MQESQKLLSVAEVAERLGVSKQAIWGLIREGTLPVVRVSTRRTRIHPDDLERWVERRTSWRPQRRTRKELAHG